VSNLGNPHAVVVGAGMAGLLAARVLSEFYESVTVVERDTLPDHAIHRRGIPQGRHLHHFLGRGTQVIGDLFPGLLDELDAAGAVVIDDGDLSRISVRIGRYQLNRTGRLADPEPLTHYQASRPFMEWHVRRRVATLDGVTIVHGYDVVEPISAGGAVTGVRIHNRDTGVVTTLNADLVVDATGRATRTPAFLTEQGLNPPPDMTTPSTWGYSSQLVHIPEARIAERMVFINQGREAPGALLVAYEHDTWMLAISCSADDGPLPTDFTEVMAAAEQIVPAHIMAGLRDATPIADIATSRNTAATWRRYDRMPHFPAGLLVIGDALCTLNPLHGQGMTMAALQVLALRDCLRDGKTDLARRFYCATAEHIGPIWAMNEANDRLPAAPTTRPLRSRLRKWITTAALKAATNDIAVAESLLRVRNLVDPPAMLQDPALMLRILRVNLRGWISLHAGKAWDRQRSHAAT
jgi:2-polyprenyl-6-methoxyphenol hydroxylase-like FAD-dependent oxidoreductase